MSNHISFFAINADDVSRARKSYERVFDWNFEPWGPPDFYLIRTGKGPEAAVGGGLQARRELVANQKMVGYECTIDIPNIDQAIRDIEANGGRLAAPKFYIPRQSSS